MSKALKKILNTSEFKTKNQITKILDDENFYLLSQTPMNKVIDSKRIQLNKKERKHYNDATFDFLICGRDGLAIIVIEFDGPQHFDNVKQEKTDFRKSNICKKAGLSILRIDDTYLEVCDKISILEFIILRFNKWHKEINELEADASYHFENRSKEAIDSDIGNMDYIDYDPTIEFNYRYQLTEVSGIEEYLEDIGIIKDVFLDSQRPKQSFYAYKQGIPIYGQDGFITYSVKYSLSTKLEKAGRILNKEEIVESIARMRWYLFKDTKEGVGWTERENNYFDIPGTSIPDLCKNIASYRALKEIKQKCNKYINVGYKIL